jgi:hypothetical protein
VEKKKSLSYEITSSGFRANSSGNLLERFVEQALQAKGYQKFWNHREQVFGNRNALGGRQYAKQVICGNTIYETPRKVDFLVINQDIFPDGLIIECKWQQSKGSVDEKYPFLLFNIIKTKVPTVILIDGSGYRKAALKFLQDEVSKTSALRGAWTMSEFQTQVNNGFFG